MNKKLAVALVIASIFASTPAISMAANYVGNSNSKKFHFESCRVAKKIKPESRVGFNDRVAAEDAGYKPCGICKP